MARKRRTEPEPRRSVVISTHTAEAVRNGINSYIETHCQRASIDVAYAAVPKFVGLLADGIDSATNGKVTLEGKDCNFAAVARFCHAKQIPGSLPLCNAIVQARLPKPKDESALYTQMLIREYGHKPGKGVKCACERCEGLEAMKAEMAK